MAVACINKHLSSHSSVLGLYKSHLQAVSLSLLPCVSPANPAVTHGHHVVCRRVINPIGNQREQLRRALSEGYVLCPAVYHGGQSLLGSLHHLQRVDVSVRVLPDRITPAKVAAIYVSPYTVINKIRNQACAGRFKIRPLLCHREMGPEFFADVIDILHILPYFLLMHSICKYGFGLPPR